MDPKFPLIEVDRFSFWVNRDRGLDFVPFQRPFGADHPAQKPLRNLPFSGTSTALDVAKYSFIAVHCKVSVTSMKLRLGGMQKGREHGRKWLNG